MNALKALQDAGNVLLGSHGEIFTLFSWPVSTAFTGIRRQRYRPINETGGLVAELSVLARRSDFGAVRPISGHEVGSGSERWRVALVQPGEIEGWIEIVMEGNQP